MIGILIMFFLDYQMRRIGLLEMKIKKLDVGKRLADLELTSSSRDKFGDRLSALESTLGVAFQAYAHSNVLNSQFNFSNPAIDDDPVFDALLNGQGISVFRTQQSREAVDDTRIGGTPFQRDFNWGKLKSIDIGQGKDRDTYRTLIKFNQIKPGMIDGGKIIGAIMYLWVYDDAQDNNEVINDIAEVYAVRKEWGEGNKESGNAGKGEASWDMASEGNGPWAVPGADDPNKDYFPVPIAVSGPHINSHTDAWVPFYFNQNGIEQLRRWINSAENPCYGFLIISRSEHKPETHTTFFSSDYWINEKRPYLRVLYIRSP